MPNLVKEGAFGPWARRRKEGEREETGERRVGGKAEAGGRPKGQREGKGTPDIQKHISPIA